MRNKLYKGFVGFCLMALLLLCPSVCEASNDILKDTTKPKVPLMKRIENFARKDNIVSKLLRTVIVFSNDNAAPVITIQDTTKVSEQPFSKFENRPIRKVNITVLNPFGYTVNDPVCYDISWLEKAGNRFHYPTRNWIVRNKLLFDENELVDAFQVSETERLLRQSAYINDAKITIAPAHDSTDSVDVHVMVQDVWGIGVGFSGDPSVPNGDITLNDINFLGLGQRLETKLRYDQRYYHDIKFDGAFVVPEIGRSYISGVAFYRFEERNTNYGVGFNRPFYTPTTPWAGGITVEVKKNFYDIRAIDSIQYSGFNTILQQDVWAGYAFKPGPDKSMYKRKAQVVLAGRISNVNYTTRNRYPADVAKNFPNETTYLTSIGYSFREYYKDRFIFGFGRTEDIPLGYLATYTAGIHDLDNLGRFYNSIKFSLGKTHSSLGYMYGSIESGGFIRNHDIEQGVFAAQFLYFTNLVPLGRWHIRQFLWNRFTLGYNRKPGEQLHINEGEGLRVFASDRIRGTQKWVGNYEVNFFAPFTPLGFRIVGVLSADLALVGTKENPLTNSRLYQGYSVGVRLKNERLVFNTFQLSLHYYPQAYQFGAREFKHYHTERPYYRFQGFEASAPYILGF